MARRFESSTSTLRIRDVWRDRYNEVAIATVLATELADNTPGVEQVFFDVCSRRRTRLETRGTAPELHQSTLHPSDRRLEWILLLVDGLR